MNVRKLGSLAIASAVGLVSLGFFQSPTRANEEVEFYCGEYRGHPATFARSARHGEVPVISWRSGWASGSGYDNQTRCRMVSGTFQNYYDRGELTYLTSGTKNDLEIICVAQSAMTGCLRDSRRGQLFTVNPEKEENADQVLNRLLALRTSASRVVIIESEPRVVIDLERYLNEAAGLHRENDRVF